jgi:hypothetical protein
VAAEAAQRRTSMGRLQAVQKQTLLSDQTRTNSEVSADVK